MTVLAACSSLIMLVENMLVTAKRGMLSTYDLREVFRVFFMAVMILKMYIVDSIRDIREPCRMSMPEREMGAMM